MVDKAKKQALDLAAKHYEEKKREARIAAIAAEDAWAAMVKLADDSVEALDDALEKVMFDGRKS